MSLNSPLNINDTANTNENRYDPFSSSDDLNSNYSHSSFDDFQGSTDDGFSQFDSSLNWDGTFNTDGDITSSQ